MAGHAVDDAAFDAHPVLGHALEVETLAAVPDEDLDPFLVDLGIDVDLVGAGVLGRIDHRLPRGADQGLHRIRGVAVADHHQLDRDAPLVLDAFAGSFEIAEVDEDLDRLTEREREVMRLIARGYTYREVAKELVLSVKTVETHVSAVLRKLQLSNRRELARWAQARNLR